VRGSVLCFKWLARKHEKHIIVLPGHCGSTQTRLSGWLKCPGTGQLRYWISIWLLIINNKDFKSWASY
jgi:hypothetical protein